jgi:hypothetical protein
MSALEFADLALANASGGYYMFATPKKVGSGRGGLM